MADVLCIICNELSNVNNIRSINTLGSVCDKCTDGLLDTDVINKFVCSRQLLREVCRILHSRGINATTIGVEHWVRHIIRKRDDINCDKWLQLVINGNKMANACLHAHFGDEL